MCCHSPLSLIVDVGMSAAAVLLSWCEASSSSTARHVARDVLSTTLDPPELIINFLGGVKGICGHGGGGCPGPGCPGPGFATARPLSYLIPILMCDRASHLSPTIPSHFIIIAFLSLFACALKRPTI